MMIMGGSEAPLVLITSCSNRKRREAGSSLELPTDSMLSAKELAERWWKLASKQDRTFGPNELYCGRSIREISSVASDLHVPLYFISAGFGLLSTSDKIPSYNVTLSHIKRLVDCNPEIDPLTLWWWAINQARGIQNPLSGILRAHPNATIIVALPKNYLQLLVSEAQALSKAQIARLRVITASTEVPAPLAAVAMPYDTRFDGPDSPSPGTKTDFAARVAKHFVSNIWQNAPRASANEQAALVETSLAMFRYPQVIERARLSDEDIRGLINKMWIETSGRTGKMLRTLRDKNGVACEQARFARLAREVREARK